MVAHSTCHRSHDEAEFATMQSQQILRLGVWLLASGQEYAVPQPQEEFDACHNVEHNAPGIAHIACQYLHVSAEHSHCTDAEHQGSATRQTCNEFVEWRYVVGLVDIESAYCYLIENARYYDERHKAQKSLQPIVGGEGEGDGPKRQGADEFGR